MENNFKDFDTTPTLTLDPFQTAEEKQEPAVVEEKKEEVATEGKYDVKNNTGKEVKELYFYDATGTDKGENYAKDGLADGATVTVNVNVDEDKAEGYAMKVEYVTEDGDDVVVFENLHLEEAPMYLKSANDVKSGATPFSKPE